ncbi:unnamed protein product [Prunus armeniaca]
MLDYEFSYSFRVDLDSRFAYLDFIGCLGVINLGGEVGCMISEGLFVGIPDVVNAWNTQTNSELSLSGPVGQVYALVVGNDLLFAGTQGDCFVKVFFFLILTTDVNSSSDPNWMNRKRRCGNLRFAPAEAVEEEGAF